MTGLQAPATTGRVPGRRPWHWFIGVGIALLLVPVLASAVTHRDPDPLFQHGWWSPIASAPRPALVVGSVGLDLLIATALMIPLRRRPTAVVVIAVVAFAVVVGAAWATLASARASLSASVIRSVLLQPGTPLPATPEAVQAVRLALSWPGSDSRGVHIHELGSVPAGPFIVQTTNVMNENASDEGADVTMESLVDPIDGRIVAAWFYGS